MAQTSPLRKTQTRLRKEGLVFAKELRQAGGAFIADTRTAGTGFAEDLNAAGTKLAQTSRASVVQLGTVLRSEGQQWQQLGLQTRNSYLAGLQTQRAQVQERALDLREQLRPAQTRNLVLKTVRDFLANATAAVDAQLKRPATKAKGSRVKRAPIPNYDALAARDVVAKLQRLPEKKATAVLDYELASKKRATVIRAAEQRLAEAS